MSAHARASGLVLGLFLLAGCASLGGAPAYSYDEGSFYSSLDPYGSWVDVSPYGYCWAPDDVAWGWRPYSVGYWAYTDFGWTWMSSEPWGWATYHYGRWLDDPQYGWVWVPGNEWAPAWVAWRTGDNWLGWAALPPGVAWGGSGISGYDARAIPDDQWCFVSGSRFLNTDLAPVLAPGARNATLVTRTRDVTSFDVRQGRPVDRGPDLAVVERLVGRRVPELAITDVSALPQGHAQAVQGTTVKMFRPTLPAVTTSPAPATKTVASARVLERQTQNWQRQSQAAMQRERAELDREQREELRRATPAAAQQIRNQQAAERQAFEARQQRENQRQQIQIERRLGHHAPVPRSAPPGMKQRYR